jgi:hypothetical protein
MSPTHRPGSGPTVGPVVTLREVFEELAGAGHPDPAAVLREHGFDLPEAELRYALVTYAHSAPVDVAGHLQPYVVANSPVSWEDTPQTVTLADGLALLATAPPPGAGSADPTADLDDVPGITLGVGGVTSAATEAADRLDAGTEAPAGRLDFGGGADAPVGPAAGPDADRVEASAADGRPAPAGGVADAGVDATGGSPPLDGTDGPWDPVGPDLFGVDAVDDGPFDGDPPSERPAAAGGDDTDGTDLIGP